MKVNPEIDELLNSFIDGELPPRQQTEIQRLIAHDPQVRQRLRQLQKCKMLLASLPFAEAPAGMLENIKAALEREALPYGPPSPLEESAGQRHLFVRKVLAVAAMVGLVAVLATVIYTIIAPRPTTLEHRIVATRSLPAAVEPVKSTLTAVAVEFNGRLELKTSSFIEVDASINRAIANNDLLNCISLTRESNASEYVLACSRKGLGLLVADLEGIWSRLDSAELVVQTKEFGRPVAINAVTPQQIGEIAGQDNFERSVEVARDFAVLNNIVENLPGKEVLTAINDRSSAFVTTPGIPKPVLTGWPKTIKESAHRPAVGGAKVNLAITVIAGK
jgi:negative regulator of sigma E activity